LYRSFFRSAPVDRKLKTISSPARTANRATELMPLIVVTRVARAYVPTRLIQRRVGPRLHSFGQRARLHRESIERPTPILTPDPRPP